MSDPIVVDEPLQAGWQNQANCLGVDPDLFFPTQGQSTREAKEVCAGCVVRAECLEHALVEPERFGIWGGLSEKERKRQRRRRQRALRAGDVARLRALPPINFTEPDDDVGHVGMPDVS